MSNNLKIELEPRKDDNGDTYYIGKLKAPILIDAKEGISFLIFVSDPGNETIQISGLNSNNNYKQKSKNSPQIFKTQNSNKYPLDDDE